MLIKIVGVNKMAALKRLAEELGMMGNEVTYYLSFKDLTSIVNGKPVSFMGDTGTIINLKVKR